MELMAHPSAAPSLINEALCRGADSGHTFIDAVKVFLRGILPVHGEASGMYCIGSEERKRKGTGTRTGTRNKEKGKRTRCIFCKGLLSCCGADCLEWGGRHPAI